MNRSVRLRNILALLVVVAWLVHWRIVWLLGDPQSLGGVVVLTFLTLSIATCVGLVRGRRWGFYSLYAAVVFGTIALSIPFIPIPLGFLAQSERWIGLTVLNLIVVLAGALADHWARADHSKALVQGAA